MFHAKCASNHSNHSNITCLENRIQINTFRLLKKSYGYFHSVKNRSNLTSFYVPEFERIYDYQIVQNVKLLGTLWKTELQSWCKKNTLSSVNYSYVPEEEKVAHIKRNCSIITTNLLMRYTIKRIINWPSALGCRDNQSSFL